MRIFRATIHSGTDEYTAKKMEQRMAVDYANKLITNDNITFYS